MPVIRGSRNHPKGCHSWRLSLLVFIAAAGNVMAGSEEAVAPCEAVAAHVKSVAADPQIVERPHGQDYDDYDALLAPIISLQPPELADAHLWSKATKLFGIDQNTAVEVQHVDGPVWRTVQVTGTAHCENDEFFSVRPDGELNVINTPAVFGDLCSAESADELH